jgi:hypothetical protein
MVTRTGFQNGSTASFKPKQPNRWGHQELYQWRTVEMPAPNEKGDIQLLVTILQKTTAISAVVLTLVLRFVDRSLRETTTPLHNLLDTSSTHCHQISYIAIARPRIQSLPLEPARQTSVPGPRSTANKVLSQVQAQKAVCDSLMSYELRQR